MALTAAALKAELQTDPIGYGYAAMITAGNHTGLADLLKLVRDGTNGGPAIVIKRSDVSSKDIWESIDVSEMQALPGTPTAAQLSTERRNLAWLSGLPAIPSIRLQKDDGTNTAVIENLSAIFPAGTATRARLVALAARNGSRAEQLFGVNTRIDHQDIARALAS